MKSFSEFSKEYDQRPEFSSQRTLSSLDFYKHDFLYSKTICEKLLSEQLVYTPKTQYSIGDFHQDKLQSLLERLNEQDQTLLVSDFNECFKVHDIQHRWTRLIKETAKEGKIKFTAREIEIYGELAVLLYIDHFLVTGTIGDLVTGINGYQPSNRIVCESRKKLKRSFDFIADKKSWNQSCKNNAKLIIDKIGRRNLELCELHHNSKLVEQLRAKGGNLSGKNRDKWNPSDIWLIRKDLDIDISKIQWNLEQLNGHLESSDDFVGVSLKKNERSPLGSVALSILNQIANYDEIKKIQNTTSQRMDYNQWIIDLVKQLIPKMKDFKIEFLDWHNFTNLDKLRLYSKIIKPNKSSYYYRNIITVLNQLNTFGSYAELSKSMRNAFTTAMSEDEKSSKFIIANGVTIRDVRYDPLKSWELKKIDFDLSTTSTVKIYAEYDNQEYCGEVRTTDASGLPRIFIRLIK